MRKKIPSTHQPPKLAKWLLSRAINKDIRSSAVGDFNEIFTHTAKHEGLFRARLWYWKQAAKSMPSFIIDALYWRFDMIRNYLKVAFRRFLRGWSYSLVNIFGLAAGLATCFLIFFYVHFESTYDRFIPNSKDKYRITMEISGEESTWKFASISAPAAAAIENQFPQVEQMVRFASESNKQVNYQDRVFQEDQILYSSPEFLSFFDVKLIEGNPETALSRPNSLLITKTMAQKYFGDEHPLDKRLMMDDTFYSVTGVIPDAPTNSHLPYQFIASFERFEEDQEFTKSKMTKRDFYTYVRLAEGSDPHEFEKQIQSLENPIESPGWNARYLIQSISDIHLHSDFERELKPPGDSTSLLILSIIGSFVFFIACFNFINLSTARSIKRATEVGIRKVVGATRTQLIFQFTSESALLVLLALMAAIGITVLFFPTYKNLVNLPLQIQDMMKPVYFAFLGGLTLLAGLGAGTYPAFFMARFDPDKVIKGARPSGTGSLTLRKALITLQFAIASLLIICALLVNKQISYMKNQQNFGFETENRMVLRMGGRKTPLSGERVQALKDEFAQHTSIKQVSVSTSVPGRSMYQESLRKQNEDWDHKRELNFLGIDFNFLSQYQIELIAGRMLDKNMSSDLNRSLLINETAAKSLGWASPEQALNKQVVTGAESSSFRIIGVVKDFHFQGLQHPIEPLMLWHFLNSDLYSAYLTLTVETQNIKKTMSFVQSKWSELFPEYPFEYFFLDEDFKRFYEKEERLSQMISILTYLGIFISCLGLWGLSSLSTKQRVKEIGIRKILGASVSGIILLLSKEFTKWVVAANIIAWPIGYLIMRNWLQNFASRTSVTLDIFIISALVALAVAWITVSLQARKAAQANPAESLRYE